jgi:hypothetical protein
VLLVLQRGWPADSTTKNHAALLKAWSGFWVGCPPRAGLGTSPASPDAGAWRRFVRPTWLATSACCGRGRRRPGTAVPARGRIAGTTVAQFQAALEDGWKPKDG